MTIPTSSNFPEGFDTDDNLFVVHDSLRVRLLEDYAPGDTSISVEGDPVAISRFPLTGLITLTEQCSDLKDRAISFYYAEFDSTTGVFSGLEILPGFDDVPKLKRITNVTMNVMDKHHNNIKDAVKAIQEFCGKKGLKDKEPFGPTLEGRINFLRELAMQPKAWFTTDKRTGNVPLEVEFDNLSFRLGTDGTSENVTITYDFGDHSASMISLVSVISATSLVPADATDLLVQDTDGGKIKKIYYKPGLYSVKLTVENDFGKDVCYFEDYINARVKAPDPAIVRLVPNASNQQSTPGVPPNGPFDTTPKIRSPINTLIQLEVPEGENPSTPGFSYAGEVLNDLGNPIDPVKTWTWSLADDLLHPNSRETKAAYSVGGVYSMKLRVDTEFGAYRITTYEDALDIVENTNIWLWVFEDDDTVRAYEYGLISETFKLLPAPTFNVSRNDSFLDGAANEAQQKREFKRNTGFAPKSTTASGQGGSALLYWASGRNSSDPVTSEKINVVEFDGLTGTYISRTPITRQWNWVNMNSPSSSFFIFGTVDSPAANTSPTNTTKQTLAFSDMSVSSTALTDSNYLNGASELKENVAIYDTGGDPIYGHFSVSRSTWRDNTGYFLRNDGVGPFFRIKSFYRTEGTVGSPFINIRKMQDIQGSTKLEGQLTNLSQGVYFLNNSGSVSKFNPEENVWRTGGPGVNSLLYRALQDTTVSGFDNQSNTLLVASDGDKRAYLSFDYSPSAFLRFSEIDLTFASLGSRPDGEQWIMGVY